jgi:CRP-like cAMP-binding protein
MHRRSEQHDALLAMKGVATNTPCRRGQEIYSREDPAESWYYIVSGLARKCAVRADGRRQIVDFLLPGDFFGFTVWLEHYFTVEAVVEGTVVSRYPRRRVEIIADDDPRVGRVIREAAFEAVSRSQARMLILGRMTARQKVGSFLVEMAERSSDNGVLGVVLPMSRYDIADYLAMSVETVSRTLTILRGLGAIALADRHRVRIVDHKALVAIGGNW